MKERIFISSVQKELAAERQALRDFVRGDPLLGSSQPSEPNGSETARTARRVRRPAGGRSPARSNRKKNRKKK